jgi:hypothetical protein
VALSCMESSMKISIPAWTPGATLSHARSGRCYA